MYRILMQISNSALYVIHRSIQAVTLLKIMEMELSEAELVLIVAIIFLYQAQLMAYLHLAIFVLQVHRLPPILLLEVSRQKLGSIMIFTSCQCIMY